MKGDVVRGDAAQDTLRLVKLTFNAAAERFDDPHLFFWDRLGRHTVELAEIEPGDVVLDVCCGTGASALPAAARTGSLGRVVGIDLAERLLGLAREKARAAGLANVGLAVGDMRHLPVADASVDATICVLGLYFAEDLPAAVAEFWRVLRPGGRLSVTTWGARSLEPGHRLFLDAVAHERKDLDVRPHPLSWSRTDTADKLRAVFADGGAAVPQIVEATVVQPVEPDHFWTIALGSGYRVFLELMSPAEVERVRVDFLARMGRESVHELTADVLYATARKTG